jgi:hypothetical protein
MLHDMTGGFNKTLREKQNVNFIYFLVILDYKLTHIAKCMVRKQTAVHYGKTRGKRKKHLGRQHVSERPIHQRLPQ